MTCGRLELGATMVEFRNSPTWQATTVQDSGPGQGRLRGDLEIEVEVRRQYGPVDIDDGPYACDRVGCPRLRGFRAQESLDRHKKLYH